jgi:hypothetical protein
MKLNDGKYWMVSDPSPRSEWADVFSGPHNWRFVLNASSGEPHFYTVYDNEREARKDAEARWQKKKGDYDRTTR